MKTKPCKCCNDDKPTAKGGGGGGGYGFNRLEGKAREWAADNQFAKSEFCVPVKDGKRFGGPQWIKDKCGNGRMGFSTRRKGQDETRMETGLEGQSKKKRHTLVRTRSARATTSRRARRVDGSKCCLVSSETINEAQCDPIVIAQKEREYKKSKRAKNRNNRARQGYKRAIRILTS